MASSSSSTVASISSVRYSLACSSNSARDFLVVIFRARPSSSQTTAFMRTRSIMPLKLFSEPIGNCAQTGRPPTRVLISSTQRKKSAPICPSY